METDYDNYLQSYFTDVEHLLVLFTDFVSAKKLPKRLIVFHGVGGVGKSSLLRMFRLYCKSEKIPVALASGDDAKSVLDVVTRWTEDLKGDGIKFAALSKTLKAYRAIHAKVKDQVKKSQNKVADIASKAASKTAEAAGGALVGAAIGSVIPGVGTAIGGTLGGVVSGMGAEALTDWLRGFLSKPDIDLLLDPAKKLSADFLEDITKAAEKKRMVLLLDTFEQMSALEDWVGETAQKIHPNVLMVIAGRKLPEWNRVWSDWMMNAQVEELKPMTEDIIHELIHRYYATMRGGEPDPAQVEAIIRFARGLPMVVTSAVQLWVKYGVEDFQSVKAEIVANLVDRLMEGVPSALIPALEAAAVVRWFDQPILRAVMNKEDVRDVYNELRRFPFVRTRVEGLALHDSVREMMDENLRVQDSERHAELHERAAVYFEKKLEKATGEEAERLGLERLYHRVRADEETGIKLFQEMAESLDNYRFVNRLQTLINEANTWSLGLESSQQWRTYYNARLAWSETRYVDAEKIYRKINEKPQPEKKLAAYLLCDLGSLLARWEHLGEPQGIEKAKSLLESSLTLYPVDTHLAISLLRLSHICHYESDWNNAERYLKQFQRFCLDNRDTYGVIEALLKRKIIAIDKGDWNAVFTLYKESKSLISDDQPALKALLLGFWGWRWTWAGRYRFGEECIREGFQIVSHLDDKGLIRDFLRELGWILTLQSKYDEATMYFKKALESAQTPKDELREAAVFEYWSVLLIKQGKYQEAERCLEKALSIRQIHKSRPIKLFVFHLFGQLYEAKKEWGLALAKYEESLQYQWIKHNYWLVATKLGLCRVKYRLGQLDRIFQIFQEAFLSAQQNEYYDHLAQLSLLQGEALFNQTKEWELAFKHLQSAMVYALRYNRFLLDELVSGRSQGTPLDPIIPYCLEHGEEGRKILSALRDWWKTSVNDVGTPRPDTISPIPEGIPLLEAEKFARGREPGDGSMQTRVVEQMEAVL